MTSASCLVPFFVRQKRFNLYKHSFYQSPFHLLAVPTSFSHADPDRRLHPAAAIALIGSSHFTTRCVQNPWKCGVVDRPANSSPLFTVSPQILVNSQSPNRPAVLYEKVTVSESGSPLLRDMLFSPDKQHIYTLTDRQVSLAGVQVTISWSML